MGQAIDQLARIATATFVARLDARHPKGVGASDVERRAGRRGVHHSRAAPRNISALINAGIPTWSHDRLVRRAAGSHQAVHEKKGALLTATNFSSRECLPRRSSPRPPRCSQEDWGLRRPHGRASHRQEGPPSGTAHTLEEAAAVSGVHHHSPAFARARFPGTHEMSSMRPSRRFDSLICSRPPGVRGGRARRRHSAGRKTRVFTMKDVILSKG